MKNPNYAKWNRKATRKQYCGFNIETGEKFSGLFLTADEVQVKREAGYSVWEGSHISALSAGLSCTSS